MYYEFHHQFHSSIKLKRGKWGKEKTRILKRNINGEYKEKMIAKKYNTDEHKTGGKYKKKHIRDQGTLLGLLCYVAQGDMGKWHRCLYWRSMMIYDLKNVSRLWVTCYQDLLLPVYSYPYSIKLHTPSILGMSGGGRLVGFWITHTLNSNILV